jgi:hypothetical protein
VLRLAPRAVRLSVAAAALSAALGCADNGLAADADVPDEAEAESGVDADTGADYGGDEHGEAEVEETTDGGEYPCFEPGLGTVDARVSVGDGTPLLSGGTIADGRYELGAVILHARAALASRVTTFTADSNGNTRGAAVFRDGAWGMSVRLDLFLSMIVVATGGTELDIATTVEAAGPFEASGGTIVTESGVCVTAATAECGTGGSFGYEAGTDEVAIEVVLTKECLTSLLPYGYRLYAGMWLENDMPVVLRFSR